VSAWRDEEFDLGHEAANDRHVASSPSPILRLLVRLAGALHPKGGMSRDMGLAFAKRTPEFKTAVEP
jgi:hypothetical protein